MRHQASHSNSASPWYIQIRCALVPTDRVSRDVEVVFINCYFGLVQGGPTTLVVTFTTTAGPQLVKTSMPSWIK